MGELFNCSMGEERVVFSGINSLIYQLFLILLEMGSLEALFSINLKTLVYDSIHTIGLQKYLQAAMSHTQVLSFKKKTFRKLYQIGVGLAAV